METATPKKRSVMKQAGMILFALGGWGAAVIIGMSLGAERNKAAQAQTTATAGTAMDAQGTAVDFLGRFYAVVEAPPVIQGDTATVKARLADMQCELVLSRHAGVNSSGWLVKGHACQR